jgi:hypothetical protein
MRFVIDAHLPPGLCEIFSRGGHDAVHTIELAVAEQNAPIAS